MQNPSIPVVDAVSLLAYAKQLGILNDQAVASPAGWRVEEKFMTAVMKLGVEEERLRREAHAEEVAETKLGLQLGELDIGQDDYPDSGSRDFTPVTTRTNSLNRGKMGSANRDTRGDCLAVLCKTLGHSIDPNIKVPSAIPKHVREELKGATGVHIGCFVYGANDPRNHVMLVQKTGKTASVRYIAIDQKHDPKDVTCAITSPMEFFNENNRFSDIAFYSSVADDSTLYAAAASTANDMSDFGTGAGFGGDAMATQVRTSGAGQSTSGRSGLPSSFDARGYPRPPASVVDESDRSGANNVSGGVVRAKRRVVRGLLSSDDVFRTRRNYQVTGVTMFNNLEEMYLNVVSQDLAQEVTDRLFEAWGLPTDQPDTMQFAEDLLHAFLIARTASNKADYNAEFDVPVRGGEIIVSFARLSTLLADTFGLTRRQYARGMSDHLRSYLRRPENQFVRSRCAQRVGADPQYGDLCFDGSDECKGLTSSESTFTSLLADRNLYERDDIIAQGASDKLMQGIHGGVRSVVQR